MRVLLLHIFESLVAFFSLIFMFMKMIMPFIPLVLPIFGSRTSNRVLRRRRRSGSTVKWLPTTSSRRCRAGASTSLTCQKQVQVTTMFHLKQDPRQTNFFCQINPWIPSMLAWWKLRISCISRWTGTFMVILTCPSEKAISNLFFAGMYILWLEVPFEMLHQEKWSNAKSLL